MIFFIKLNLSLKTSNLSGDKLQKILGLDGVDNWTHDTGKWYWSADTLFWQLLIDHNVDVQYVCIISFSVLPNYLSLQCGRILGGRNLVRIRIVVAAIFDFMTVEDWGE